MPVNWCLIPPAIWEHDKLNLTEKCLLGRIYSLSQKGGKCFASNNYFAKELGRSSGSVSNLVSSLVERNFLIRSLIRNENKQIEDRLLEVNMPFILSSLSIKKWIPYPQKNGYPIHKNMEGREEIRIDIRRERNFPKSLKNSKYLEILEDDFLG